MDVLVVSGCSGEKQFDAMPIGCGEIDATSREELLQEFPDYVAPAAEMYTGAEHEIVREAVTNLRAYANVTWRIASAGYGLLDEDEEIVAYDCSLSDIEPVRERAVRLEYDPEALTIDETRQAIGRETDTVRDLEQTIAGGYDLVFIVLSKPYLVTVSEALADVTGVTVIAFASQGAKEYTGDAYWVPATAEVRAELETSWFRVRGELLRALSERRTILSLLTLLRDQKLWENWLLQFGKRFVRNRAGRLC